MGVIKRIIGWEASRWPIPRPLQVLAGMVEPRDPEAYQERKRAEREAREERKSIQWEANLEQDPAGKGGDLARPDPAGDRRSDAGGRPARPGRRRAGSVHPQVRPLLGSERELDPEGLAIGDAAPLRPASGAAARPSPAPPSVPALNDDVEDQAPAWGDELPVRAQPGWYRLGRNFYRVGEGPFAAWGFPEPQREPATIQRTLFD
jgi:hypothetical protein